MKTINEILSFKSLGWKSLIPRGDSQVGDPGDAKALGAGRREAGLGTGQGSPLI